MSHQIKGSVDQLRSKLLELLPQASGYNYPGLELPNGYYINYCHKHVAVDTGMKWSYCKTCNKQLVFDLEQGYIEDPRAAKC